MSEDTAVYTVDCPDCGRKANERCVYMWPKGVDPAFVHYRSPLVQEKVDRVGRPTRRAHNGRINALAERRLRAVARERRRRDKARPASAARIAAARAEREFDAREWAQLRDWLAAHGTLFRERPAPPGIR